MRKEKWMTKYGELDGWAPVYRHPENHCCYACPICGGIFNSEEDAATHCGSKPLPEQES